MMKEKRREREPTQADLERSIAGMREVRQELLEAASEMGDQIRHYESLLIAEPAFGATS